MASIKSSPSPLDYTIRSDLKKKKQMQLATQILVRLIVIDEKWNTISRIYFEGMKIVSKVYWYNIF